MRRSLLLLIALAALVAAPARAHVWFSATLDTEQAAGADYGSVDFYYFQHSTHVYFQVNTTDVLELTSLALVQEDESTGNLTVVLNLLDSTLDLEFDTPYSGSTEQFGVTRTATFTPYYANPSGVFFASNATSALKAGELQIAATFDENSPFTVVADLTRRNAPSNTPEGWTVDLTDPSTWEPYLVGEGAYTGSSH